jgi:hypothetical protein
MMGRWSDATASQHYPRANAGRKVIVPSPDPEQVASARRVIDLNLLGKLIAGDNTPPTPKVSP